MTKTETSADERAGIAEVPMGQIQAQFDHNLLRNLVTSQYVALFNALILGGLLLSSVTGGHILFWMVSLFGLTGMRLYLAKSLQRKNRSLQSGEKLSLDGLGFAAGLLWGLTPFLAGADALGMKLELITFMLAGMTAGAAVAFASHIRSVLAFNTPALSVFGLYLVMAGTIQSYAMCAVLVLYFVAILAMSRRSRETLARSIDYQQKASRREVQLELKEASLQQEMLRRAAKEEELQATLSKTQRINLELEAISKYVIQSRDKDSTEIKLELLARLNAVLGIRRASIWLFTPERDAIVCQLLHDSVSGASTDPVILKVEDYPEYFRALETSRVIDASFAREDPQTREFTESYFKPLDVHSLLDAPILAGKESAGVICCEAVGNVHVWTPEEISFVASVAQFIAMQFMAEEAEALATARQAALLEARRASATKSAFLANMSHEIRTPMNGVLGAATALTDTQLDSEQAKFVNVIQGSGDTLMNILNDILDFSKIEAGQVRVEQAPFSLRAVLHKVGAIHELKARERGLEFKMVIADSLDDMRIGDAHRLGQVLHNLISNAIKFTHEGSVELRAAPDKGSKDAVKISVCDTGVGMSDNELARAFEHFGQADNSTTRKYGGTGLGLSIVNGLVSVMKGELVAETRKGSGSTFCVKLALPVTAGQTSAVPVENDVVDLSAVPQKILLAEDNETNRLVIEAFLKPLGVDLVCVGNGAEAVEACACRDFDVVLMDIQMPVMDGTQALKEIRHHESESGATSVPILAVTANAMHHQVEYYRSLGFDGHLAKPIRREVLINMLCRVVREPARADTVSQPA